MSLLRSALERDVGPVEVHESQADETPSEAPWRAFADELLETMPDLIEGTDSLQHENDILTVANMALEEGIRSVTDFLNWMSRQESLARKSGMWVQKVGPAPVEPTIVQVAKYLRMQRAIGRNLEVGGGQRF